MRLMDSHVPSKCERSNRMAPFQELFFLKVLYLVLNI